MDINTLNSLRRHIAKSPISISTISKSSKVSRTSIHRFINGDTLKKSTANKIIKAMQSVYNEQIIVQDDFSQVKEIDVNASYIIELQKDKISLLESKISTLQKQIDISLTKNNVFENMDYDVMTHQTYDVDCNAPYKWFSSYTIIRWKDFCKKLGYVGQEAVDLHNYLQAVSTNKKDYNGKTFKVFTDDSKFALSDYLYTQKFFKNAKLKHFINAVESYNVSYIHKDGSLVPAILFVLYDVKGDSSISKIKFLNKY